MPASLKTLLISVADTIPRLTGFDSAFLENEKAHEISRSIVPLET